MAYDTPFSSAPTSTPSWQSWANTIDPLGERQTLASTLPTLYSYGQPTKDYGISYDPERGGLSYDSITSILGHNQILSFSDAYQKSHPSTWMNANPQQGQVASGSVGKAINGSEALDSYDQAFVAAAAKYGVPANLLKAVATEENGWADPVSAAGAQGIMQIMPSFWGNEAAQLGYGDFASNPVNNIMMGAYILNQMNAGDPTWEKGVRSYLGGDDPYTGVSNDEYWNNIKSYWNQMNTTGGSSAGADSGATAYGWNQRFDIMFGTGVWSTPDWGAFGADSANGLYGYGTDYGLNGVQHTGIDVPLNLNTPMGAGFSGHVVCGGTGWGNGEDSCAAFNDDFGDGAGRIEIMSDDGNTVLIYGHSSRSNVKPGQHVNPGDIVGFSGGQNSAHVHLEARIRTNVCTPGGPSDCTNSGWRVVDARTVLGGAAVSGNPLPPGTAGNPGGGTSTGSGTGAPSTSPLQGDLGKAIWGAVSGAPSYLGPSGSDFHQWLSGRIFNSGVGG